MDLHVLQGVRCLLHSSEKSAKKKLPQIALIGAEKGRTAWEIFFRLASGTPGASSLWEENSC
jgi:hypothetical protein